jgi:hypothetical protein
VLSYLLLGVILLLLFLSAAHWFARADTQTLLLAIKWIGGVLAALVALYLIASGRAFQIIWVALLLPVFWRMIRRFGSGRPTGGQSSDVETDYLRMTLDHDSGEMSGVVLQGAYAGRAFGDLGLDELLGLFEECLRADEKGAQVLEAYLDRSRHTDWRDSMDARGAAGGTDGRPGAAEMTIAEAREILGVGEDAGADEIKTAHRDLMQRNHPDRGGSTYLAAKINLAKELLLGH